MKMPVFRVTERKLKENLGEPYIYYFNPLRSKRLWQPMLLFLSSSFLLLILLWWFGFFVQSILVIIVIIFTQLMLYGLMKLQFRSEVGSKMKQLVNDPELLWLNNCSQVWLEKNIGKEIQWGRSMKGFLAPVTFEVLKYLKKEGTSQGIYNKIKTMKNSNSAYINLKRLAEKRVFDEPIVQVLNNDFKYVPWQFRLVDEKNQFLTGLRTQKIEKLLMESWDEMMDEEVLL